MPVDVGFHWVMLNDYDRNAAYRAAIRRSAPGRTVYDLGAGVGPMSYYALAAGARRVYGFEIDRDIFPYLARLTRAFPNFQPLRTDVTRDRLPQDTPELVVCEMWSTWLTEWPMIRALNRIRRQAAAARVIPRRAYHCVQLVQAQHRSGLPLDFAPQAEATLFNEACAVSEMSLPTLACVTDFQRLVDPVDMSVEITPLTTGTANAVRFYSYEEVSAGLILPRLQTRADELLRWLKPLRVRRGRRVRLRIRHRWDSSLRVWPE
jgi:hypothetical protein